MPRAPLLALALMLLAGACAQTARADDPAAPGARVTIAPSAGGDVRSLALADLAGRFDVHGATYTLRHADGTTTSVPVAEGISLTALLAAAGLDADAFDYVAIPGADGSSAIVLRDELAGTDEGPPVVWADAQGVRFLRPSTGADDANGADHVTLPGGPLAIALRTGEPLVPRIAVSTLRARPRRRVEFGASLVGGAPLGPGLEYEWYFDGTGRVRGANVSHRFPRAGSYVVLLNVVRGDGTWIGDPARVRIRVVRAREPRPDAAQRSGDEAGGGGAGANGGAGSGTGDGGGTGAGDAPAPFAPPVPAAPAAATPPAAAREPAQTPRSRPRGQLVSGTLLASASAAPPGGGAADTVPSTGASAAAARGAASEGPLHVPVGAWAAIGLVVLLALGWALESRHTLPFWQP